MYVLIYDFNLWDQNFEFLLLSPCFMYSNFDYDLNFDLKFSVYDL